MTRTTDDGCTHGSWWGSGCITVIAPYGHAAQCRTIKKWLVSQRKIPDADDAGEATLMYCWEESSLWSWPVCHGLLWRRVALGEELPEQSLTTSGLQVFLFSPNALAENPTPACPLKLLFNLGVIQQILISWFTFPLFFFILSSIVQRPDGFHGGGIKTHKMQCVFAFRSESHWVIE